MPDLRSPSQTTRQFSKNNKKPSARLIVNSLEKHSMGNSTDTWENIQKSDIKAPMNTKEDLFEQNANLRNSLNSKLRDYNIDMVNASNDNRPLSFLEQKKIKKAFKTSQLRKPNPNYRSKESVNYNKQSSEDSIAAGFKISSKPKPPQNVNFDNENKFEKTGGYRFGKNNLNKTYR